ncbi:hypothetical protein [Nitrosococcus watsonii]|uniref:Uncharacterized protein n=1 Tax=Nitrosococcus watsoni (strain C-113) TaxID=105559 RepID=D8KCC0_NITWC|nr:hypothetical protein [Nitrosococcus watsonii]ADJ29861.1 hypothetical protein Nwat_3144 [Nitrosococcus watsonii C-113]
MTHQTGTGKPQAANTGEPDPPGRTHTRNPKPTATERANTRATRGERTGTNTQAGAGDQPGPPGSARHAHTQPERQTRATTPAPREEGTETKPRDINNPQNRKHPTTRGQDARGTRPKAPGGTPSAHRPGGGGTAAIKKQPGLARPCKGELRQEAESRQARAGIARAPLRGRDSLGTRNTPPANRRGRKLKRRRTRREGARKPADI